ncbi:MAG: DUF815 domain-containing protein [bacterium]|nr:DUF815 domain-containing protein [bacterium]
MAPVEKGGRTNPYEDLKKKALQWELSQNVRSGRTAKQFVDYLCEAADTGELFA